MAVKPPSPDLSLDACLDRHRGIGGRSSLVVVDSVDSTNRLARRIARIYLQGERPMPRLVVVARTQSAGRGRRGNSWLSPAGQGIYTSLLLQATDVTELAALPLRVPLALCQALTEVGVDCGIKWPNDLVAEGRKLGGVLIESLSGGRAVIAGYGINGSQTESTLPMAGATSLRLLNPGSLQLSRLAIDLAEAVLVHLSSSQSMVETVEAYSARSAHRLGDRLRCRLGDEVVDGSFAGFDELGRLRLATATGERALGSVELLSEVATGTAVNGEALCGEGLSGEGPAGT